MIDGKTKVCGLIGCPVEHTASPVIHNNLARLQGHNLTYVPFHVEQGRLKAAVAGAYALNLLGLNVTVPYKTDVMPYLKEVDELAAKIGAVNTLVRVDGGYRGYNTDMPGLYRAMVSDGVRIEGADTVILGAGGVARAVAVLLAEKGAGEITICNRTAEKAHAIAEEVNSLQGRKLVKVLPLQDYEKLTGRKYLVIQATSVGLHPDSDRAVIEEERFYSLIHTGYDLIFNPWETKFMKLTQAAGGKAYNGSKMLLYQGIIAYELWNGTAVTEEQAQEIYRLMNSGETQGERR